MCCLLEINIRKLKNTTMSVGIFLMITYIALFSALLSRLTALACGSTSVHE